MDWLPSTPSDVREWPAGCRRVGQQGDAADPIAMLAPWLDQDVVPDLLLLLAATRTAEQEGISAAGSTPAARRMTALADAELLLKGPLVAPSWPLPTLPAGVSPALLSHAVAARLGLQPQVAAVGLLSQPDFDYLQLECPDLGPADCLSSGAAMPQDRVNHLWRQGEKLGAGLQRPLLLAECVPGGTTTAQAVLTALGFEVGDLISGSARQPPKRLKSALVAQGLRKAHLSKGCSAEQVLGRLGIRFRWWRRDCWWALFDHSNPCFWGAAVKCWPFWRWPCMPYQSRLEQLCCVRFLSGQRLGLLMKGLAPVEPPPWIVLSMPSAHGLAHRWPYSPQVFTSMPVPIRLCVTMNSDTSRKVLALGRRCSWLN